MLDIINTVLTVDVVNTDGVKIDEHTFVNPPISVLFPDECDVVLIDWLNLGKRPTSEELVMPVEYQGKDYYGAYAWGSAVKRGITLGITHDFPQESGVVKFAEDGQRVSRWLFAMGIYGAGQGDLHVKIVKGGTVIPGCGPVEDGFGYIRKDIANAIHSGLDEIQLSRARDNYMFTQRIDWDTVKEETLPMINDLVVGVADFSNLLYDYIGEFGDRQELARLDENMAQHPYVANALSRASGDIYARIASNIPLNGMYRVAVPTLMPTIVWPEHTGKFGCFRSPIDSNGSIQAVDVDDNPRYQAEAERIGGMEVVQHTLATTEFAAKGCLGIVDDIPGGYDVVLCADDIKMVRGDLKATRKLSETQLENAVLVFTNWWTQTSTVGVNAKWAKNLMGLDHDGDALTLFDLNERPALYQAIKDLTPGTTPKLVKTHTPIADGDERPDMVSKSMANLVGFASNVMTATFMVKDRAWLAQQLGFNSEAALDKTLNYFVKVGTDGFKTQVDQDAVAKHIAVVQSNLQRMFGTLAPWTRWPNDWAFRRGIPSMADEATTNTEKREAIYPWMDGTVAEILRMTLIPMKGILSTPIMVRPLTEFRGWALSISKDDYERANVIQHWFNARAKRTNWSDPNEIAKMKIELAAEVSKLSMDRWIAANALWRVAHSSRSTETSAASVFMAFPEECRRIIAEKPGRKPRKMTVLTGLNYQVPGLTEVELDVRIVDVETTKGRRIIIRKAICGEIDGQLTPTNPMYPTDMLGMVAVNADQPEQGSYHASIRQVSQGAWECVLI